MGGTHECPWPAEPRALQRDTRPAPAFPTHLARPPGRPGAAPPPAGALPAGLPQPKLLVCVCVCPFSPGVPLEDGMQGNALSRPGSATTELSRRGRREPPDPGGYRACGGMRCLHINRQGKNKIK